MVGTYLEGRDRKNSICFAVVGSGRKTKTRETTIKMVARGDG